MKAAFAGAMIACLLVTPCLGASKADKVRKQISDAMEGLKECPTLSVNLPRLEMLQTERNSVLASVLCRMKISLEGAGQYRPIPYFVPFNIN